MPPCLKVVNQCQWHLVFCVHWCCCLFFPLKINIQIQWMHLLCSVSHAFRQRVRCNLAPISPLHSWNCLNTCNNFRLVKYFCRSSNPCHTTNFAFLDNPLSMKCFRLANITTVYSFSEPLWQSDYQKNFAACTPLNEGLLSTPLFFSRYSFNFHNISTLPPSTHVDDKTLCVSSVDWIFSSSCFELSKWIGNVSGQFFPGVATPT